jgi:hypothetical protein
VFYFRRIRLELAILGSGTVTVTLDTDLPVISGGGVANRYSKTVNGPLTRKRLEPDLTVPGTTKGNSFRLDITPSSGCAVIVYKAPQIEIKKGDGPGQWFWFSVPGFVETPDSWQKMRFPVVQTPNEWQKLPFPIIPTPNQWQNLGFPIVKTPNDWRKLQMPVEKAQDQYRWVDMPVSEES